jgi:hypothetical protein
MELDSHPAVVMVPAVCFDRARQIHKTQRLTRDALIAVTGDRRTSQVWFAQYHGADAARNAMRNLGIDDTPTLADLAQLDQVHTFLNHAGDHGVLIVAACEVTHD